MKKEKIKKKNDLYGNDQKWQNFKHQYYNKNMIVISEWGVINFKKDFLKEVRRTGKLTFDELLDLQRKSNDTLRHFLAECYYEDPYPILSGTIDKIDKNGCRVCFNRLKVEYGIIPVREGYEDHVWVVSNEFKQFKKGDFLEFSADVYCYVKQNPEKLLNFGLENPTNIRKIVNYELPTDDEILMQRINDIVCEVCSFTDHCDGLNCIAK